LILGPHRSGLGFLGHSVTAGKANSSIGLVMDSMSLMVGFSTHTLKKYRKYFSVHLSGLVMWALDSVILFSNPSVVEPFSTKQLELPSPFSLV